MSEVLSRKTSVETITFQTLGVLREHGITKADVRKEQVIGAGGILFRWTSNDEFGILVPDSGYILSLNFDGEDPELPCSGEILDEDGNLINMVDAENLQEFADYLLMLLWD